MAIVNSVLGPINTADMGFTLAHEHVLVSSAGVQQTFPEFINRHGYIEKAVQDLSEAREEGLGTIVDLTTHDLGRDVLLMEEVAWRSGVHIVACTGTWRDIPRIFWSADPDWIAPLYVREIEEGIEQTGIKAGIIKVANDEGGVTLAGAIILRAAARAQRATNVPISTHTWAPERIGEQQIRIFEEENVDLDRVYIGHSNDTTDVDYLLGLLKKGVWVGLDRYPGGHHPGTPSWNERTVVVKHLIDAGYAGRIMLSHDWSVVLDDDKTPVSRKQRLLANPDAYLFIKRRVLPRLSEMGVSEDVIRQIMVDNPRRFFEGS